MALYPHPVGDRDGRPPQAIRFAPADPRDPSPALFLSTDFPRKRWVAPAARMTALSGDIAAMDDADAAKALRSPAVFDRCVRERLTATVVSHADAVAEIGEVGA